MILKNFDLFEKIIFISIFHFCYLYFPTIITKHININIISHIFQFRNKNIRIIQKHFSLHFSSSKILRIWNKIFMFLVKNNDQFYQKSTYVFILTSSVLLLVIDTSQQTAPTRYEIISFYGPINR